MSARRKFLGVVSAQDPRTACDFIAQLSGLSKSKTKDAMNKGAAWLIRAGAGRKRLRRASADLRVGDRIELFFDEQVLGQAPLACPLLLDRTHYSAWDKPPGMLAQGTDYGDHNSVLRVAEQFFKPPRATFLVHRLDRETRGLMLIAHSADAAARFTRLFQDHRIEKQYIARVRGRVQPETGSIDFPLDGKSAHTEYRVSQHDAGTDTTDLELRISTGRMHQIRRHLEQIGHPVLGDPRYGTGNKNETGMQLAAVGLRFHCPYRGDEVLILAEREGAGTTDPRLT